MVPLASTNLFTYKISYKIHKGLKAKEIFNTNEKIIGTIKKNYQHRILKGSFGQNRVGFSTNYKYVSCKDNV